MTGTLYGIGVGPGDPDLITLKGWRILRGAAVVAYPAPEHGDSLARRIAEPHLLPEQREFPIRMPLTVERFPAQAVYDQAAAELGEILSAGSDVAVLCEGDPFFYGSFMYLFARMAERFSVEVIPGVSSLMATAAALNSPLAARNDILTVLPAPLDDDRLLAALQQTDAAAIIKLGRHFDRVRTLLTVNGMAGCSRYIERATMDQQVIHQLDQVDPAAVPYFSMILVHRRRDAWL